MNTYRLLALALLGIACSACARPQATRPVSATPTIAAAVPIAPTRTVLSAAVAPATTTAPNATPAASPQASDAATFRYLWPSYLPDGMAIAPTESRIPNENEVGTTAPGFYIATWNGGDRKLVIGGGATDTLPLQGETRQVAFDNGNATLTTSGEQRQLVFVRDRAKFFVYGRNIGEPELMVVAESLLPTDIAALRDIIAGKPQ